MRRSRRKNALRHRDVYRIAKLNGVSHLGKFKVIASNICRVKGIEPPATKKAAKLFLASLIDVLPAQSFVEIKRPMIGVAEKKSADSFAASDAFLASYEWRKLRMVALKRDGARCACCGATPADGVRMNVDHIRPRRLFPELALELSNLQILCEVCNHGKGNWDQTDWRVSETAANDEESMRHIRAIVNEQL